VFQSRWSGAADVEEERGAAGEELNVEAERIGFVGEDALKRMLRLGRDTRRELVVCWEASDLLERGEEVVWKELGVMIDGWSLQLRAAPLMVGAVHNMLVGCAGGWCWWWEL